MRSFTPNLSFLVKIKSCDVVNLGNFPCRHSPAIGRAVSIDFARIEFGIIYNLKDVGQQMLKNWHNRVLLTYFFSSITFSAVMFSSFSSSSTRSAFTSSGPTKSSPIAHGLLSLWTDLFIFESCKLWKPARLQVFSSCGRGTTRPARNYSSLLLF